MNVVHISWILGIASAASLATAQSQRHNYYPSQGTLPSEQGWTQEFPDDTWWNDGTDSVDGGIYQMQSEPELVHIWFPQQLLPYEASNGLRIEAELKIDNSDYKHFSNGAHRAGYYLATCRDDVGAWYVVGIANDILYLSSHDNSQDGPETVVADFTSNDGRFHNYVLVVDQDGAEVLVDGQSLLTLPPDPTRIVTKTSIYWGDGSYYVGCDIELANMEVLINCSADFNNDGEVNTLDVLAFLNAWTGGDREGDFNNDGEVNTLDVLALLNAWATGC